VYLSVANGLVCRGISHLATDFCEEGFEPDAQPVDLWKDELTEARGRSVSGAGYGHIIGTGGERSHQAPSVPIGSTDEGGRSLEADLRIAECVIPDADYFDKQQPAHRWKRFDRPNRFGGRVCSED